MKPLDGCRVSTTEIQLIRVTGPIDRRHEVARYLKTLEFDIRGIALGETEFIITAERPSDWTPNPDNPQGLTPP